MTLATVYLTPEGVVLGTDSTTTITKPKGERYLNHAQKLFQVDEAGSLAIALYGSAGLGLVSFRTVIARLGDRFADTATRPATVEIAASEFQALIFAAAQTSFQSEIDAADAAKKKRATGAMLLPAEEKIILDVQNFSCGFYVAGRDCRDRAPAAYMVNVPLSAAPAPVRLGNGWAMNGAPEIPVRLLRGWNESLLSVVMAAKDASGTPRWSGTVDELKAVLAPLEYEIPHVLPIREAVDFVPSSLR